MGTMEDDYNGPRIQVVKEEVVKDVVVEKILEVSTLLGSKKDEDPEGMRELAARVKELERQLEEEKDKVLEAQWSQASKPKEEVKEKEKEPKVEKKEEVKTNIKEVVMEKDPNLEIQEQLQKHM